VEKKQVEYKLQLPEKLVLPFIRILKIIFLANSNSQNFL
jgi:hypothetical protein